MIVRRAVELWNRESDVNLMDGISGIDISITLSTNCTPGSLNFDSASLWIKSYIYDRAPEVKINEQSSDVFYFIQDYNLIGVSLSESIYKTFGIAQNSSYSNDQNVGLNLTVNGIESRWTVRPDITIKRECSGRTFPSIKDEDPDILYLSSIAIKGAALSWLPLLLLLL